LWLQAAKNLTAAKKKKQRTRQLTITITTASTEGKKKSGTAQKYWTTN